MSASAMQIFLTMIAMLDLANASPEKVEEAECRITNLANAINSYSIEYDADPIRLIAMAFQESRFMYDHPDGWAESHAGACGPFQQIPRYAHPRDEPIDCAGLQDPYEATRRVIAKLENMTQRFGPVEESICHYASGNVCTERGQGYAERHHTYYARAQRIHRRIGQNEIVSPQQQIYQERSQVTSCDCPH